MECEDANHFFERQKVVDRAVAKLLNKKNTSKNNDGSTEIGNIYPLLRLETLFGIYAPLTVAINSPVDG